MNEIVTNKTPKRRRWIARLLVSALCILLASSLLFVSVVAENVNAITREKVEQSSSDSKRFFGYHFSSDGFMGVTECSVNPSAFQYIYIYKFGSTDPVTTVTISIPNISVFGGCSSGEDWIATWHYDGTVIVVNVWDYQGNKLDFDSFSVSGFSSFYGAYGWGYVSTVFYNGSDFLLNIGYKTSSDTLYLRYLAETEFDVSFRYPIFNGSQWVFYTNYAYVLTNDFSVVAQEDSVSVSLTIVLYSGKNIIGWLPTGSKFLISFSNGYVSQTTSLPLTGRYGGVYLFDILLPNFQDELVGFGVGNDFDSYYLMYVTSSEYVPPESSDETTEEPPSESSDESSEDPVEGGTKIWKVDRGFKESYAGTVDLSDATRIRAFLGVFTSSGSSFSSDQAVPLTLEVYRVGSETPDVYTFEFYAYGWGVLGLDGFPNSYDSYTFPDVVGRYYEIPIPSDGEGLLFPTFAPYGFVYVNFSDSVYPDNIQRVTFNLHNPQGYLDVNFVSSSSTSFTIYNDDLSKGITYSFNSGTFNYKCFFDLDGEYSETEWFSPQFGSSIRYYAEDVLESGLYAIYSFNEDSIEYPWGNGEWSNTIVGNNSRLEDISLDYAILESKANALYGNYSFYPLFGADFNDAVSRFNVVKDSSGGQTLLGFFNGMWSVHPFASSMIAIVGTLAIVGFIIRKL